MPVRLGLLPDLLQTNHVTEVPACQHVSLRVYLRLALSTSLALRPAYIEHQLDGDDGGAAGGDRFAFGTALEAVGHRRFGGC